MRYTRVTGNLVTGTYWQLTQKPATEEAPTDMPQSHNGERETESFQFESGRRGD